MTRPRAPRTAYKWIRQEIRALDPVRDSEQITRLTTLQLLPRSLMVVHLLYVLGFVRFAGPPESAVTVDRDGTGMVYAHGVRRADETMYHLLAWIDDGASHPRTLEGFDHVRKWHSAVDRDWPMPQHTFLHSAAVFTLLLDRLLTRVVGAPGLTEDEREAQLGHWTAVSVGMGVENPPGSWDETIACLEEYEDGPHFRYSPEGRRLADALIDQFAQRWFPRPLRWLGRWIALAFCEEHVLMALRIPPPPRPFVTTVRALARSGVFAVRHLLPDPRELRRSSDVIAHHRRSALRPRGGAGAGEQVRPAG